MNRFLAHFLFILAAWTLCIKFFMPVIWAVFEGVGITTYIFWDLWWAVHIWLGYALITQPRYMWTLAAVVSLIEINIVIIKLFEFLGEPDWSVWNMNWFVNKLFVLTCFILVIYQCVRYRMRSARTD